MLDDAVLRSVFIKKQDEIAGFAKYFYDSMSNPQTFIQFADVDEFARLLKILFEICPELNVKSEILQYMINFSHVYNRYPAMAITGEAISSLSDEDVKKLYVFLGKNKHKLNDMKGHFNTPIPVFLNQLLSE